MTEDRLPCGGRPNDRLHHADGSHRITPASTRGRVLERHEDALRRHLAKISDGEAR